MSNKNIICKVLLTNALLALLIVPASHNANAQGTVVKTAIKGSGTSTKIVEAATKEISTTIKAATKAATPPSAWEKAFSMMGGTSGYIDIKSSSYSTTGMNPADIPAANSSLISPSLSERIELPPLHKKILAERPVFALEGPHNQLLKERGIAFKAVYAPQTKDLTHFTIEFETALGQPSRLHLPEQQFDFLTEALHQNLYFAKEGEGLSTTLRAGITKDHPIQFIFSPAKNNVVIKIQKKGVPVEYWSTAAEYEYLSKDIISSLVYLLETKKLHFRGATDSEFIFSLSPYSHIEWSWSTHSAKKVHPNLADLRKAEGLIQQLKVGNFQVAPVEMKNGMEIPTYVEVKGPFDTAWHRVWLEDYWVKDALKSLKESYTKKYIEDRRLESEKLLQENTELFNHGIIVKDYVPGPQGTFEFKLKPEEPFTTVSLDNAQKEVFDKAYRSNLEIVYLEDLGFGYVPTKEFPIAWNNALPKKAGNYNKVLTKWEKLPHKVKSRLKTGTVNGKNFHQGGWEPVTQDGMINISYFSNEPLMLAPEKLASGDLVQKLDKTLTYLERNPNSYIYMYDNQGIVEFRELGQGFGNGKIHLSNLDLLY